jgi:CheY-like chemotaxis protein
MAKVMLVEDDNNLREIYEARLQAEGYEIVPAQDGEEALALAVKEKPDLIIADVMMPKISGFDMVDILRTTPETKDTKIIVMTALNQAEDKERAEKVGADRYLVKSQVTLEDVVKVAKEMLGEPLETPAPAAPTDPAAATMTAPIAVSEPPAAPTDPATQSNAGPLVPNQPLPAMSGPTVAPVTIDDQGNISVPGAESEPVTQPSVTSETVSTSEPPTPFATEEVPMPTSEPTTPPTNPIETPPVDVSSNSGVSTTPEPTFSTNEPVFMPTIVQPTVEQNQPAEEAPTPLVDPTLANISVATQSTPPTSIMPEPPAAEPTATATPIPIIEPEESVPAETAPALPPEAPSPTAETPEQATAQKLMSDLANDTTGEQTNSRHELAAHGRVIEPPADSNNKPDLNALLAQEEASEAAETASASPTPGAEITPPDTMPTSPVTEPTPPTTPPADNTPGVDPNSIAL